MSAEPAINDDARSDKLDRILQIARAERAARNSNEWKFNIDGAIDRHAEIVELLYGELYRQLDERATVGKPVPKWKPPPDAKVELQKRITRALKSELPSIIADAVASIIDQES